MIKTKSIVLLSLGLLLPAFAAGEDWKLGASATFDTGKYGSGDRTSRLYVPFTLKRYYRQGELSVTLPYVRQSSTGLVTTVGGAPVRAAKVTRHSRTSASASSESGPGDLLLRGLLELKTEGPGAFDLSLSGKLKLPTADEKKGLGTGEMDEGAGLEFAKRLDQTSTLLADAYYTLIGEPAGTSYNDQLALDVGLYRRFGESLWLTALYETSGAIVPGAPDQRDLNFVLDAKEDGGWNYFGGLLLGLSDGRPDYGLTAGASLKF